MSFIELEILNEDFKEICSMYWDTDGYSDFIHTLSSIAKKFNTTSYEVSKKVKNSCIAHSTALKCKSCEASYIYTSRADFNKQSLYKDYICHSCTEKQKEEQEQQKLSKLLQHYEYSISSSLEIDSMSFKEAVFLLSVVKHQASEDLEFLKPYSSNQTNLLSPSKEYDIEILRKLTNENILCISPKSELSAIEITEDNSIRYYINQVSWEIPIDTKIYPHPKYFIVELEDKLKSLEWNDNWYDGAKELCKEIALQESLAYLDLVMTEHQFNFSAGEKTILVLTKILENCSVAQAYNLIWRSAKDAAAYYMRSNIPKPQAANSVVGNMERMYERYSINKWEIKPYKRNYNLPASVLSQVLYSTILDTDDGGFHMPVEKII